MAVIVSGYFNKNDSELGKKIRLEADAFLTKDSGLEELTHKIQKLLDCKR